MVSWLDGMQKQTWRNQMNLDKITIGRDPVLTYQIMNNIAKREIKRRERQAKWMRIVSTLKFWK